MRQLVPCRGTLLWSCFQQPPNPVMRQLVVEQPRNPVEQLEVEQLVVEQLVVEQQRHTWLSSRPPSGGR